MAIYLVKLTNRYSPSLNACTVWPLYVRYEYGLTTYEIVVIREMYVREREGCNMGLNVTGY